jgi:hypothetical protein
LTALEITPVAFIITAMLPAVTTINWVAINFAGRSIIPISETLQRTGPLLLPGAFMAMPQLLKQTAVSHVHHGITDIKTRTSLLTR